MELSKKRNFAYFDILKFILIFLVVFGHIIEKYIDFPLIKSIYLFIYSFHMPLFVFISGFFAKYNKSKCYNYLFLYFLLQIIHIILSLTIIAPKSQYSFIDILGFIFAPQWTLWYLLALAFWIFTLKFIKKINIKLICALVILSLILGFVPFISTPLSLSRIIYFFPFFLLGKYFGENKEKFTEKIKELKKPIFKILSIVYLILLFIVLFLLASKFDIDFFYGSTPYSNIYDFPIRLIIYILAFLTSLSVLILTPMKNDENIYAGGGFYNIISPYNIGKRTLSIYLLHPIIILFLNKFLSFSTLHLSLILVLCFILAIIIVIFTSLPIFQNFINRLKFYKTN